MSGSYRSRRGYGHEQPEPDHIRNPTLPKARPMSTRPSEDELSHLAIGRVNEYEPQEEAEDDNGSPPRSPIISTVSKGLQTLTKKMGIVPKLKISGDTPRKVKEPKSPDFSPWRVAIPTGRYYGPKDWPKGLKYIGRDRGADGYRYYEDQRGVRYRSPLGDQFESSWAYRTDGKYEKEYFES